MQRKIRGVIDLMQETARISPYLRHWCLALCVWPLLPDTLKAGIGLPSVPAITGHSLCVEYQANQADNSKCDNY